MGRRKVGSERVRSIQKTNGGYTISIPIELMREFGWQERQRVVVKQSGRGKLSISDYQPKGK